MRKLDSIRAIEPPGAAFNVIVSKPGSQEDTNKIPGSI